MRITESRLRKIIRSVIRESMTSGAMSRDFDSAVEACKVGDRNSVDDHHELNPVIEEKIKNYIDDNFIGELDTEIHRHSGAGRVEDQQYTFGTDQYNQQVLSRGRHQDYDELIRNMPEEDYQRIVTACQTNLTDIPKY